jgi:hypothetical protein
MDDPAGLKPQNYGDIPLPAVSERQQSAADVT